MAINLDIIDSIFSSFGKIEVYQNKVKNTFVFKKEDISHHFGDFDRDFLYLIRGSLQEDELKLIDGECCFQFNNSYYCCSIYDIFDGGVVDIRIKINPLKLSRIVTVSNFSSLFTKYEGEIFKDDIPILSRFEILDIR